MRHEELLHDYLDGEFSPERAAELERVLAGDADLAARLARLESVQGALDLLPGHDAPADFTERVAAEARLDGALDLLPGHEAPAGFTARVLGTTGPRRGWILKLAAPLAAAAAVLVAVLLQGGETPDEPPIPVVEYRWENDVETFDSLSLTDLEDEILEELEAT